MKPLFLTLIALFFISLNSVIIESKLAKISPLANVFILHLLICGLVFPLLFLSYNSDLNIVWPKNQQWLFIVLASIFSFMASTCIFSAYHQGGSLILITTVTASVPIVATGLKYLLGLNRPSTPQLIGCILAILAVWLVTKG